MRANRITVGWVTAKAEVNETRTATAIWEARPAAAASIWGDEIAFDIPLALGAERGQETVGPGDLGDWEPGGALCIVHGRTPVSRGDAIRPYRPVTGFGWMRGEAGVWKATPAGAPVRIARLTAGREGA